MLFWTKSRSDSDGDRGGCRCRIDRYRFVRGPVFVAKTVAEGTMDILRVADVRDGSGDSQGAPHPDMESDPLDHVRLQAGEQVFDRLVPVIQLNGRC